MGPDSSQDAGATQEATTIPFAVDDVYAASGYMGDGENGAITDDTLCADPRPGNKSGLCHRFTIVPGSLGWAGVFWQYPEFNWGDGPGFDVPPGASRVRFYAWGGKGDETLKFLVGISEADGFGLESQPISLTTTPTQYEIDLSTVTYSQVVGGFGWVAGDLVDTTSFFLDDIRWE
jgi:hypothetical protein